MQSFTQFINVKSDYFLLDNPSLSTVKKIYFFPNSIL